MKRTPNQTAPQSHSAAVRASASVSASVFACVEENTVRTWEEVESGRSKELQQLLRKITKVLLFSRPHARTYEREGRDLRWAVFVVQGSNHRSNQQSVGTHIHKHTTITHARTPIPHTQTHSHTHARTVALYVRRSLTKVDISCCVKTGCSDCMYAFTSAYHTAVSANKERLE